MAPPTATKRPHNAMTRGGGTIDSLPPPPQEQWIETPGGGFEFDCHKYNYVPGDDGGYWQLQPQYFEEQPQLPHVVPLSVTSRPFAVNKQDGDYTCLSPVCLSKPFKNKTDLDMHYKQAHNDSQTQPSPALSLTELTPATSISNPSPKIGVKPKAAGNNNAKGANAPLRNNSMSTAAGAGKDKDTDFCCDYPACDRRDSAFSRKDRLRAHLHDVHKEDVPKKSERITDQWWQERKIYSGWWRCTKCMDRVKTAENGYECPRDNSKCEDMRREFRQEKFM